MNYIFIGFMFAIGWFLGRVVIDVVVTTIERKIKRSKLYKTVICKSEKNDKVPYRPYHDTRMGFKP